MTIFNRIFGLFAATVLFFSLIGARAQDIWMYKDSLANGFQDWSWGCTRDFNNTKTVHSGTKSIAVTITSAGGALRFQEYPSTVNVSIYASLSFWINGGNTGGQSLQVQAITNGIGVGSPVALVSLPASSWQHFVLPLSTLGVGGAITNIDGFIFQDASGESQPVFYLDDVEVLLGALPSTVHLKVDASKTNGFKADARWFGLNTAAWDSHLGSNSTITALTALGTKVLRWPGGSWADVYHWNNEAYNSGTSGDGWPRTNWGAFTTNFMTLATNINAQAFIIVNYGSGTPEEAAAWVRNANITNNCGFTNWEVGNECYGSWEADSNTVSPNVAHDPWTYAQRFTNYYTQMKTADPRIKIGAVVVRGEDSYANNTSHPVTNNGVVHNGWTPVMLTTLRTLGSIRPDFVIDHLYPENQPDGDPVLLQSTAIWAGEAQDLRSQLRTYLHDFNSTVEIVCTENNADAGNQGRQSTSIVDGLYLADSLSQIMNTEFKAYVWWALRNGPDTSGDFNSTLYGWRTWGDLGIMYLDDVFYPTYYCMKLMHDFVQAGDSVLNASSDYSLLPAYAATNSSGTLSLLVINKHASTNLTGQIILTNFIPASAAIIHSYGIAQDEAARTNAPASAQDIAVSTYYPVSTNFTYSFPPYSLTLFTFSPFTGAPPQLTALPLSQQPAGQFVFQLQGQIAVPYVIQMSPDLVGWTSVSTNTPTGSPYYVTNAAPATATQRFWRAVWQQP
jgi:hypothetical protein